MGRLPRAAYGKAEGQSPPDSRPQPHVRADAPPPSATCSRERNPTKPCVRLRSTSYANQVRRNIRAGSSNASVGPEVPKCTKHRHISASCPSPLCRPPPSRRRIFFRTFLPPHSTCLPHSCTLVIRPPSSEQSSCSNMGDANARTLLGQMARSAASDAAIWAPRARNAARLGGRWWPGGPYESSVGRAVQHNGGEPDIASTGTSCLSTLLLSLPGAVHTSCGNTFLYQHHAEPNHRQQRCRKDLKDCTSHHIQQQCGDAVRNPVVKAFKGAAAE